MERSTIFNGKIHYKWAIFNSYVKLPEGRYNVWMSSNTCIIRYDLLITDLSYAWWILYSNTTERWPHPQENVSHMGDRNITHILETWIPIISYWFISTSILIFRDLGRFFTHSLTHYEMQTTKQSTSSTPRRCASCLCRRACYVLRSKCLANRKDKLEWL